MRRFTAISLIMCALLTLAACGEGPGGSLPAPVAPEEEETGSE